MSSTTGHAEATRAGSLARRPRAGRFPVPALAALVAVVLAVLPAAGGAVPVGPDQVLDLRTAAEDGDALAAWKLAMLLLEGPGSRSSIGEGMRWLRVAAERGVPEAAVELGVRLVLGQDVSRDPDRGRQFLEQGTRGWSAERTWWCGVERYFQALDELPHDEAGRARAVALMEAFLELARDRGHRPSAVFLADEPVGRGLAKPAPVPWRRPAWFLRNPLGRLVRGALLHDRDPTPEGAAAAAWYYRAAAEGGEGPAAFRLALVLAEGRPGAVPRDVDEAGRWMERAARLDDAWGLAAFGELELEGRAPSEGYRRAAPWFERAAELRIPFGQASYGYMLAYGLGGVERDVERAVRLVREAVDAGDAYGMRVLADFYWHGTGVPVDRERALELVHRAAELGEPGSMRILAIAYRKGRLGLRPDPEQAEAWTRRLIEAGEPAGYLQYGYLQEGAGGVYPRNMRRSFLWSRLAADQGIREACFAVGICYQRGMGVRQDFAAAADWFRRGVELEDAKSAYALGLAYLSGTGVPRDDRAAIRLLRRAIEWGACPAMTTLGELYLNGDGVEQDTAEAVRLFRRAADSDCPGGLRFLGLLYLYGVGVEKDEPRGLQLLEQAAAQGDIAALADLGLLYLGPTEEEPWPVVPDYARARRLLARAARSFEPRATNDLGWIYEAGLGVPPDYRRAWCWYAAAVELGDATAAIGLGDLLAAGHGVERDPVRAWAWYEVARQRGLAEEAEEGQARLAEELSPEQVAEARALGLRWARRFLPDRAEDVVQPEERVVPRPFACPSVQRMADEAELASPAGDDR